MITGMAEGLHNWPRRRAMIAAIKSARFEGHRYYIFYPPGDGVGNTRQQTHTFFRAVVRGRKDQKGGQNGRTDQETARTYLEGRLWPKGPKCPACKTGDRITPRKGGFYRCNACKEDFTVRTGTIFERSHVPLHKWLYAMYLLVTARKGISSLQLSKEIGITQKSAWFVLHRLREALKRLDSFVDSTVGNRITYKELTA
jgi:transposase-like protein